MTAHRRENLGASLTEICLALRDVITETDDDVRIVFPVHLNPHVWGPVHDILGDVPRIILIPPLDYVSLVHLLKRCHLVVTDSGGLQEEAPCLGVPVLVLRDVTERQEGRSTRASPGWWAPLARGLPARRFVCSGTEARMGRWPAR